MCIQYCGRHLLTFNIEIWRYLLSVQVFEKGLDRLISFSCANPQMNSERGLLQLDYNPQGPPSFALQLVQRTLEESLGSVQKAIHEDVQNLHLELLRQFHIQQVW